MPTSSVEDVVTTVLSGARRLVVVDVEATCWKKGVFSRKKETIEIGAVLVRLDRRPVAMAGVSDVREAAAAAAPLQLLPRADRYHAGRR